MRGGFLALANDGSAVSSVDLEATRAEREGLHDQVRLWNHLLKLLTSVPVDEDLVRVTPCSLLDSSS